MDSLTEIQRWLNQVPCPQCLKSAFDLTLQCQLNYNECLYTAKCRFCNHLFNITTETKNFSKNYPGVAKSLSELRYHSCDKVGVELRFRCDLKERACLYVVICKHCGERMHYYQEEKES